MGRGPATDAAWPGRGVPNWTRLAGCVRRIPLTGPSGGEKRTSVAGWLRRIAGRAHPRDPTHAPRTVLGGCRARALPRKQLYRPKVRTCRAFRPGCRTPGRFGSRRTNARTRTSPTPARPPADRSFRTGPTLATERLGPTRPAPTAAPNRRGVRNRKVRLCREGVTVRSWRGIGQELSGWNLAGATREDHSRPKPPTEEAFLSLSRGDEGRDVRGRAGTPRRSPGSR